MLDAISKQGKILYDDLFNKKTGFYVQRSAVLSFVISICHTKEIGQAVGSAGLAALASCIDVALRPLWVKIAPKFEGKLAGYEEMIFSVINVTAAFALVTSMTTLKVDLLKAILGTVGCSLIFKYVLGESIGKQSIYIFP